MHNCLHGDASIRVKWAIRPSPSSLNSWISIEETLRFPQFWLPIHPRKACCLFLHLCYHRSEVDLYLADFVCLRNGSERQ